MMTYRKLFLLTSIVLLFFASCTDEVQELANEQSQALKQIVMTTQDFQPESDSRTIYQVADGAVKCTWAENDTVGVFPDKGGQVYFPMTSGAGTKNASFNGGGWSLTDGSVYSAYYPFIGAMYLERNAVPVSYTGQTQVGNGSMAHLGDYDYMVATPTAPEFGSAQFMFKHLSALVQLKITVPQPATFTSVKLVTDTKAFAVEGTMDIMAETSGITTVTSAKEIKLDLQNVKTTEANQVVTLYMMLPPADLSAQTLKAVVVSDKGTQDIALETRNFKAGKAYALSGEMENTDLGYKDGVIRMAEAGTMTQLLGENLLKITSLKVVGPINGDDVRCLRQMLGGNIKYDVNIEKGKLTSLDLSDASIVEGDNWYYKYYYENYYTSNDIIGGYMFHECDNLQDIVLPVGVTSIGDNAFEGCFSLTSIDIPESVTSIGDNAFDGCSSLTSIDIPESVTSIGHYAFWSCSSLTSIDIPEGVTTIGGSAFERCSSLTSIAIPEGVTSIGEVTFYDCSSLTSIDIPEGVTSIGNGAFEGCSSLASIDMPESVSSIGNYAFRNCSSLASIDIPKSVTSIGNATFCGCSSLTSIDIPEGVTSIGDDAFYVCYSLKSVHITDLSAWCKITFSNSFSNPLYGGAKLYLNNQELTELTIPADIKLIKNYAFYGYKALAKVTMGEGVTSVGIQSFRECSSLTQVYCYGTTPPTINPSSTNSSFNGSKDGKTLYVPKGYLSAYQASSWADFFGTITEMD